MRGSKSEIEILIGKHLLWFQLKILVAWVSARAGEMDRGREGDLGYNSFEVVVSKNPNGFNLRKKKTPHS